MNRARRGSAPSALGEFSAPMPRKIAEDDSDHRASRATACGTPSSLIHLVAGSISRDLIR